MGLSKEDKRFVLWAVIFLVLYHITFFIVGQI